MRALGCAGSWEKTMSTDDRMDAMLTSAGQSWRDEHDRPADVDFSAVASSPPATESHPVVPIAGAGHLRRPHRRVAVWVSAAAVAAAVMATLVAIRLGTGSEHNGPSAAGLDGTDWRLVAMRKADGTSLAVIEPAPLKFDSGSVGGTDGCNHLGGPARIGPTEIVLGDIAMTEMACINRPAGFDAEVNLIHAVLAGKIAWTVAGDELTLTKDGAGALIYRAVRHTATTDPAALVGGWVLTTIEQNGVASTPVFDAALTIDGGDTYTVGHRCSQTQGSVQIGSGTATFADPRNVSHSCPSAQGAGEIAEAATIDSVLSGTVHWLIKDRQLTITKSGVGSLVYRPATPGLPPVPTATSTTAR
jgi:heat shock protein HslJ